MSEEHTPEPWERYPSSPLCFGEKGKPPIGKVADLDTSRRIVACVNACAGIPTEALERRQLGDVLAPSLLAATQRERDELLAALRRLVDPLEKAGAIEAAKSAIAKVEGGAE